MVMAEVTPAELKAVEDLKKEYADRVKKTDQQATNLHWIWYLVEKSKLDGSQNFYYELQQKPHYQGLDNILEYVRDKGVTHRKFYDNMRTNTADLYVQHLTDNKIISTLPPQSYYDMTAEAALEGIKAFYPLIGTDLSGPGCPEAVARPAAIIWFRYVEQCHAIFKLPTVGDLQKDVEILGVYEKEVLESNVFTNYVIANEKEREDLTKLITKAVVGGLDT